MVRGKGKGTLQEAPPAHILTHSEIAALEDEKSEMENQLKIKNEYGAGTAASQIDEGALKRGIAKIDHELEKGAVPKVKSAEKDRLYKESEELKEILKRDMPTYFEMHHPARCPGAVQKHMRWNQRNIANIQRFVYIQRIINPDAPESVEGLRKEK